MIDTCLNVMQFVAGVHITCKLLPPVVLPSFREKSCFHKINRIIFTTSYFSYNNYKTLVFYISYLNNSLLKIE